MAVFKNSARLLGFFEGRLRRMEETCDMRVFIRHRPDFDRDGGASGGYQIDFKSRTQKMKPWQSHFNRVIAR